VPSLGGATVVVFRERIVAWGVSEIAFACSLGGSRSLEEP
jgi:hypothetical protein